VDATNPAHRQARLVAVKAEHESCRAASVGFPFTSRGHACAVEGPATTPHGAWTNTKPNGKLAHALGASGGLESGKDSFFLGPGYRGLKRIARRPVETHGAPSRQVVLELASAVCTNASGLLGSARAKMEIRAFRSS
jgi:hypothetical protein